MQNKTVICKNIEDILRQVKTKKEVTIDDLTEYLEIMESSGGASQYLLVQAETFLLMSNEIEKVYGIDSKECNKQLRETIRDIEEHIRVLEEITSTIEFEQTKDKKGHPSFKYQTQDAWFVPTHSQREEHVI